MIAVGNESAMPAGANRAPAGIRAERGETKASEEWLGRRDSNPNKQSQSLLSYR